MFPVLGKLLDRVSEEGSSLAPSPQFHIHERQSHLQLSSLRSRTLTKNGRYSKTITNLERLKARIASPDVAVVCITWGLWINWCLMLTKQTELNNWFLRSWDEFQNRNSAAGARLKTGVLDLECYGEKKRDDTKLDNCKKSAASVAWTSARKHLTCNCFEKYINMNIFSDFWWILSLVNVPLIDPRTIHRSIRKVHLIWGLCTNMRGGNLVLVYDWGTVRTRGFAWIRMLAERKTLDIGQHQ